MERKAYLIQPMYDGHDDHTAAVLEALKRANWGVEPYRASAPIPAFPGFPVSAPPASVPSAAVPAVPVPWPGANVRPAKNGNGFKAYDSALNESWLYNADARPFTEGLRKGQSAANAWKINVGGKGRFGAWYSLDDRAALVGGAQDATKRPKR